ncbi:MAG: sodium ion-translocating decarboxylase subunit beta, partial [Ruminococcaceae bacterium]|nr:sodium ion-translocating decarboxylase subunit beta [Oscillospiraceae bacterium]
MEFLYENLLSLTWQQVVMWLIGGLLIYLAIKHDMEPTLLLPMGFGTILVNLPLSGAIGEEGVLTTLFNAGIANELFPLLLFIGIGAMIDFSPVLSNPKLMIFGAAAQFGIFFTLCVADIFFDLKEAASIGIIGAADGPTAIVVANKLLGTDSPITGAIMVAAYSYMALVPIIQPPVIKLLTTRKERMIRMPYSEKPVSRVTKILFPIVITIVAGLVAPASVALSHAEPRIDVANNMIVFEHIELIDENGEIIDLEALGNDKPVTVKFNVGDAFNVGDTVIVYHDGEIFATPVVDADKNITYTATHFCEVTVGYNDGKIDT